ncbi:tyrosinase [Ceratobasidium sp. AG-Ba]|nr:tyrosinase [Ceratobasidium sp. AG-Ba]
MKFFAAAILALTGFVSAMPAEKRAGNCTSPAVHMEWRSLSQAQRNSFHNAVKCLQTKASNVNGVSSFNRYPSVHSDVFGSVHYVAQFLPWHRWFLHLRRLDLQDCGYTGPVPYWDWTIDSGKLATSNIWDPTTGFGGNGNTRTSAHCVENGPYANFQLTYPSRHCLARRFNNGNVRSGVLGTMQGSQYSSSMIQQVLNNNNYNDFSNDVEEIPHDAIHNVISGDMAAAFSPNDALFFLHHQNIDRLWAKWQGRGSRLQEYTGNTVQGQSQTDGSRFPLAKLSDTMPMKGIRGLPDIRVADVMDTMSDSLCYVYDK